MSYLLAAPSNQGGFPGIFLIIPLVLIFFFFTSRSQRRRRQQLAQTQHDVAPGAHVQTAAGLLATVVAVEDDVIVLEVAPGVHSRFVRQAVARVVRPAETVLPPVVPEQDTREEPPTERPAG